MKIILFLSLLLAAHGLLAQPNPPILRQPLTTNSHSGQAPNDWNIAIWNPSIKRWLTPTNVLIRIASPNDGISTNFFFDTQIHRANATSKLFAIYNGGSNAVTIGPNGGLTMGRGFNTPFPGGVLLAVFDTTLGETNLNEIFVQSKRSGSSYFGATDLLTDTNDASFILTAFKGPTGDDASRFAFQVGEGLNPDSFTSFTMQFLSFTHDYFHVDPDFTLLTRTNYLFSSSVRVTNTHILMSLQNSNTPVLEVDGVGDLRMIKRVPYIWPVAQGAAGTAITNDGSGNLGWGLVPSGGSGAFIRSDSTGRGTNTTFVSAFTNLDDWVSSTGVLDTAIGVNVWPLGGNAKRNTFIGQNIAYGLVVNSGDDLTNSDNVVVGSSNLENLNGGYRNVGIGSTALQAITSGNGNIGIGYRALTSITTGGNNIGIGDGANFLATNAQGCTAVGIETLLNATNNLAFATALGYHAGYGTLTQTGSAGAFSTWIGAQSGGELWPLRSHHGTTAVGANSGNYGGSNCTYLGYFAGRYNSNDNGILIIDGFDRGSYTGEKTDAILYGRLATSLANQHLMINGKVAISTTNPGPAQLMVNGFVAVTGSTGGLVVQGDNNLTTGAGWEIKYSGGTGFFDAFDRGASAWRPGVFRGSTFQVNGNGGTRAITVDTAGSVGIMAPTMTATLQVTNANSLATVLSVDATAWKAALMVSSNGAVTTMAGGSSTNAVMGGAVFSSTASFTNLNATGAMTNLANVSIPAHFLTNTSATIHAVWGGKMPSAAVNTNQFQIVFGSSTILDTGLQIASNTTFKAECWIVGTGLTGQHAEGYFTWGPGGGVPFAFTNSNLEIAETNGIATTLALKGGALRLGAHTNNFFRVWYEPATR